MVLTDSPGVVMVRSDYERMLSTHGVASTADLLLPETPADVRRLLQVAYYRPPLVPNFLLRDTLQVTLLVAGTHSKRLTRDLAGLLRSLQRILQSSSFVPLSSSHFASFSPSRSKGTYQSSLRECAADGEKRSRLRRFCPPRNIRLNRAEIVL